MPYHSKFPWFCKESHKAPSLTTIAVPIVVAAGLAIGIGAALYANREEIRQFAEQKMLELSLSKDARKRQRHRTQGDLVAGGASGGPHGEMYHMSEIAQDDNDDNDLYDDNTDRESIDTVEFLSQGMTNYYSSGHTTSAPSDDARDSYRGAASSHSAYTRDGEFLVRRRGGGPSDPINVPSNSLHFPPSSYAAPPPYTAGSFSYSSDNEDGFPLHHFHSSDTASYTSGNPFPGSRDTMNRANSLASDASWIMSSGTDDSFSELETPTASEHEFSEDERTRVIIGQSY